MDKELDLEQLGIIGPPLRVWWIPQIPMEPFLVRVNSLVAAKVLLETLAAYDAFQLENNVKPDYSNAGGVCVLEEDGEWVDFESEDGDSIDTMSLADCARFDHVFYDSTLRAAAEGR
jgi:hypothetical protein